jgi:hypothetical protein
MDDLFTLKYSDDIIDLFLKFKEISKNHGSTLFDKKCNSYDLIEFLEKNTYLVENINVIRENEMVEEE